MVTCATRSFGMRVAKLLSDKFDVVKSTSDEIPDLLKDQFIKIPTGVNPVFCHELLKACLDNNCNYILPLDLSEIQSISESIILFEEYGIEVLSPTLADLEELEVVQNPPKEISLSLISRGKSLLEDNMILTVQVSGLGLLSDSGEDFILAVSK